MAQRTCRYHLHNEIRLDRCLCEWARHVFLPSFLGESIFCRLVIVIPSEKNSNWTSACTCSGFKETEATEDVMAYISSTELQPYLRQLHSEQDYFEVSVYLYLDIKIMYNG